MLTADFMRRDSLTPYKQRLDDHRLLVHTMLEYVSSVDFLHLDVISKFLTENSSVRNRPHSRINTVIL
jgi:hypothetical protein